jgi:hypothetical protein
MCEQAPDFFNALTGLALSSTTVAFQGDVLAAYPGGDGSWSKNQTKRKEEAMKKLLSVIAVGMLVGAVGSWGAPVETTNVLSQVDITLKATLSDGTKKSEADLEGTGDFSALDLQTISGTTTGEVNVLAKSVVTSNDVLTSATILLEEISGVDLSIGKSGKSVEAFVSTGVDTNINGAVWLVFGMTKTNMKGATTNTTFTGKVEGIWKDTSTSFKGTLGSVKKK